MLILTIEQPEGLTVLFTQHAGHLRDYANEIGFPGGCCEVGDSTPETIALREAEEIGLLPTQCRVLGRLGYTRPAPAFA